MQERFWSKKHNVFTEEVIKIALIANNDKRIQSIDCKETYLYSKSKSIIRKNEEIKDKSTLKQYKK